MVENFLKDYDIAYGMKSISLRYFNAAGADPECEIGEDHAPETHLIPLILDVALGKKERITIMGNNYNTKDGTCLRDYIHVTDLATAHLLGLEYIEERKVSQAYNLGNGKGYSVLDVIGAVEKITGRIINRDIGGRRPGDPDCLVADADKIKTDIGWISEYKDIETIIEHAWEWHKRRFGYSK
jgi:UDP-glucose 4-epimerase